MTYVQALEYAETHIEKGEKVVFYLTEKGGWDVAHIDFAGRPKENAKTSLPLVDAAREETEGAFIRVV